MQTLLYLLYGSVHEYHLELTYSVLSALKHAGTSPDFKIVLATDEKTRREDLPIEHLTFSAEELSEWTFGGRFNHAAKIGALRKASALFEGKIALLDTDTYFLASPSEIFNRIDDEHVVMHADEGTLEGGFQNYNELIEHEQRHGNAPYHFDSGSKMINSGVVGLSDRAKPILTDAMRQTRYLVDISDHHIHTLEQFSLGVTLGAHFKLRMSDDIVRHYHGYERRFIHKRIKDIFPTFSSSSFEEALSVPASVDGFPAKRKLDVIRAKIKGVQRRDLNNFGFAYLSYASSLSARSAAEANAWAGTALDVVTHNNYPRHIIAAEFERFRAERLRSLTWLEPSVRDRWTNFWNSEAD